jgi:tRNA dimethylallyltransferase
MKQDWTVIGLKREKSAASRQINSRVKKMIAAGLVDEVKSLLSEDKPLSKQARCAIGYAEIIDYLNERISLEDATELIKKNTRRLAKNQRTWFKTFENVHWLDIYPGKGADDTLARIIALLNNIR